MTIRFVAAAFGGVPFSDDTFYQHHSGFGMHVLAICVFDQILLPWGFSFDLPANYNDLLALANLGNDALKAVHGTK